MTLSQIDYLQTIKNGKFMVSKPGNLRNCLFENKKSCLKSLDANNEIFQTIKNVEIHGMKTIKYIIIVSKP